MKIQQLLSLTRQAVDHYNMIEDNDKIAIGISGGKDSLALLYALAQMKRFYPKKYELVALTVDTGVDGMDFSKVEKLCEELDVPYYIIHTQIYDIVFNERKESNPCSLCSKMRKGTLNDKALELGCNKIAYAHHKDDLVETFLMSFMFEGRLHTFSPVTKLEKTGLSVIRPLIYINEKNIIGFKNRYNLPVVKNNCAADGHTCREDMKELLKSLNKSYLGVRDRMFTAITNGNMEDWPVRHISGK